jgi:RNA polymerase sigma-70 factor, ECF subfamily
MLLHGARRETRIGDDGRLVRLADQDRSRWDPAAIAEGVTLTGRALRRGHYGPYGLQAAIAAVHAEARSTVETDWTEIAGLYDELARIAPSPVVELNRAVAVAEAYGPEAGLDLVETVAEGGRLDTYHLLHAVRGGLLERLGRTDEARAEFRRARELVVNPVERLFLDERSGPVAR